MGGGLHLVGERQDGSTFPIEVSLNHVATAGGGRAFAFVTDITERQRAASALQERTRRTGIPDDATEPDGVGPDARRAAMRASRSPRRCTTGSSSCWSSRA